VGTESRCVPGEESGATFCNTLCEIKHLRLFLTDYGEPVSAATHPAQLSKVAARMYADEACVIHRKSGRPFTPCRASDF